MRENRLLHLFGVCNIASFVNKSSNVTFEKLTSATFTPVAFSIAGTDNYGDGAVITPCVILAKECFLYLRVFCFQGVSNVCHNCDDS